MEPIKTMSALFSSGCVGGCIKTIALGIAYASGWAQHYGVHLNTPLSIDWLIPQTVYGGLWALIFLLPFLNKMTFLMGLLASLIPAAIQLLVIFPFIENQGLMGQSMGAYAPLFFLGSWILWGGVTMIWFKMIK